MVWQLVDDPCGSQDSVVIGFTDPGFNLDLDGEEGLSNNDFLAFVSMWGQQALDGGDLDVDGSGRVSILSLVRACNCTPQ